MIEFDIGHKYSRAVSQHKMNACRFQHSTHGKLHSVTGPVDIDLYNVALLESIPLFGVLWPYTTIEAVVAYCVAGEVRASLVFLLCVFDNTDHNCILFCLFYFYFE